MSSLFPTWFRCEGENGYQEYTDTEEVADLNLDMFGGYYEETDRPSANPDLNQPQTKMGMLQTDLVERVWMRGEDDA